METEDTITSACSESERTNINDDDSLNISGRIESNGSQVSEDVELGIDSSTTRRISASSKNTPSSPFPSFRCPSVHQASVKEGLDDDDSNREKNRDRSKDLPPNTTDGDSEHIEEECCSICLEGYLEHEVICTPKTGGCNHQFHKKCLFQWVHNGHAECPLCRTVLLVDEEEQMLLLEKKEVGEQPTSADPSA